MFEYIRVSSYLDLGSVVEWVYRSKPHHQSLYFSETGTDPWVLLSENVSPDINTFIVSKSNFPGLSEIVFKVVALDKYGSIVDQAELTVDLSNTSGRTPLPVAVTPEGNPVFLKTDTGGNLMVSAITLDAAGMGDASASLQGQQLSLMSTINNTSLSIVSGVNSVTSKLNDVRINSSQISDLKSVTVTNHPSSYPYPEALASLEGIRSTIPQSSQVADLLTELEKKLNTSDLNISPGGILNTSVYNMPLEFPDSQTTAELQFANAHLIGIESLSEVSSDKLSSIDAYTEAVVNSLFPTLINTITTSVISEIMSVASKLEDIRIENASAYAYLATDSGLTNISTKLDYLVKQADLPMYDGKLNTYISGGLPSDFPDAEAHSSLSTLNSKIAYVNTEAVTISSPLPSGQNKIGVVEVDTLPLPANAAKDTTMVSIYNNISAVLSELSSSSSASIKYKLDIISSRLQELNSRMEEEYSSDPLFHGTLSINAGGQATTGVVHTPSRDGIDIGIACDPLAGVRVTVQTSEDGVIFFPIKGFSSISLEGGVMHTLQVPVTMSHCRIDMTNSSNLVPVQALHVIVNKG